MNKNTNNLLHKPFIYLEKTDDDSYTLYCIVHVSNEYSDVHLSFHEPQKKTDETLVDLQIKEPHVDLHIKREDEPTLSIKLSSLIINTSKKKDATKISVKSYVEHKNSAPEESGTASIQYEDADNN